MVSIASKTATTWGYLGSSSPNSGMVCRTNVIVEITTIARDMKPITYNRMLKIMHTRGKIEFNVQSLESAITDSGSVRSLRVFSEVPKICADPANSRFTEVLFFFPFVHSDLGQSLAFHFFLTSFPLWKPISKKRSWEQMYQNILSRQTNNT